MALTARMVTIDCADPGGLAKFWSEAAGYEVTWRYENEYLILAAGSGQGPQLDLQRVPEPKIGKNQVHIDWAADDRPAEVERLVMADPEGNEFCVSGSHG
ncbi:VOC family protein [Phytohabitans rumicis]|nr:VOC family protein [Phytohabitans rumicis]